MKGIQLFTVPYETSGASACWQMMNFECQLMVASSADTSARSVGQRISGFHELPLRSIQIRNEQGPSRRDNILSEPPASAIWTKVYHEIPRHLGSIFRSIAMPWGHLGPL